MDRERTPQQWDGPALDAWHPWTPDEVSTRLTGTSAVWCVVGGWSIDLFLGRATREHDDLEIATTPEDFASIRECLAGFVFHEVGDGTVRRMSDDEPLGEHHQHWCLDEPADAWRVDVMVEPGDAGTWIFRRDERVRAPRATMVRTTPSGVPYLLPHGTLLYKAKAVREKDAADFDAAVPMMDAAHRHWLAESLQVVHPGHPWLDRLA